MRDLTGGATTAMPDLLISSDRPAAGILEVRSPFDASLVGVVPVADDIHVDEALEVAASLFEDRSRWLSLPERVSILNRLVDLMEARQQELALLAAREGGKPLRDSKVEVTRAIDGVRLCVETLRGHRGQVVPVAATHATADRIAFTQNEPRGVVVAVSAFNHPLNLIVHQVAPAVATGCPVIVKPADDTPLSCFAFVELLHKAGLPPAWCQAFLTEDIASAQRLVTDPRVAFFSFIGSSRVGWMLRSKLAPGTRCALEHGGVAPVVLLEDFDAAAAIPALTKGGFYHAGQVCVSVQRVYVPAARARALAIALAESAEALVVGDPSQLDTDVGPLIRASEVTRVHEWVQEAADAGGEVLCGGRALGNNCYAPTVILNPPDDVRVSAQEIFGPVVCVYAYDDVADAVARANALPMIFQAAVFGRDLDRTMAVANRLDASAVMINDHTAFRDDVMPFAGLRESGLGIGGIPYTMADMQVEKMVVMRSGTP